MATIAATTLVAGACGSAENAISTATTPTTTTTSSTTRTTPTTEDDAQDELEAELADFAGPSQQIPAGGISVAEDMVVSQPSEGLPPPDAVTSWLFAPASASAINWSDAWTPDRYWNAQFATTDGVDSVVDFYDLATKTSASSDGDVSVVEVEVEFAQGGVWLVSYEILGSSIESFVTITITHELVDPTPRLIAHLAAVGQTRGWKEDGPIPMIPGAFCASLWEFERSDRYADDLPLYSSEATSMIDFMKASLDPRKAQNADWRELLEDLEVTGTATDYMDNSRLTFLGTKESTLSSGCPDVGGSSTDTTPAPVQAGDLIAILASVPIAERPEADRRADEMRESGLNAFILDSRDWDELGDPFWVIAIGPMDRFYAGEDCAVIEMEHPVDGCVLRDL